MTLFLIFISTLALVISKIALFVFLLFSFIIELKSQKIEEKYISREQRKIKIPQKDESLIIIELKKTILRRTTLLWTMSIGEIVGYIFLILSQHPIKFRVLEINATWLLLGSLLCQLLTMMNAWLKKKMDLLFRIEFQFGLVILGGILISIVTSYNVLTINQFLMIIVLAYFSTTVLAIFSMLIDAMIAKQGIYDFDYNHYSRLVILIGLIIGSGITFIFI